MQEDFDEITKQRENEYKRRRNQKRIITAIVTFIILGISFIVYLILPQSFIKNFFSKDSKKSYVVFENTDGIKRPVQREMNGDGSPTNPVDSDSVNVADTTIIHIPPAEKIEEPAKQGPILTKSSKSFEINENGYQIKYDLTANNGLIHCEIFINDTKDVSDFTYNSYVDASIILEQFEGLAHFWAATDLGNQIVDSEGHYKDEFMMATLNQLKQSFEALGKGRGESQFAAENARMKYNKLKELRNRKDETSLNNIKAIVWEMNEHPISTKQLRLN